MKKYIIIDTDDNQHIEVRTQKGLDCVTGDLEYSTGYFTYFRDDQNGVVEVSWHNPKGKRLKSIKLDYGHLVDLVYITKILGMDTDEMYELKEM